MTHHARVLPAPVGWLLSRLPAYPGSLLFATALHLSLGSSIATDVKKLLWNKKLRLRVLDTGWDFDFEWNGSYFAGCHPLPNPDLTISANAHDFYLLARRQEDPDTLFFNRRLCMEGDTELGLLVKNTLDAIDLPALDIMKLHPSRLLDQLKARWKLP